MTFVRPEQDPGEKGGVKDDAADYWVEGWTLGQKGMVFIDGVKQTNVVAVKTEQEVNGATRVTITYLARSLNKGERPE